MRTLIIFEEFYNLRKGISRPIPKKETLVILHGYGGAGVLFFPIMKKLAKYFNLIFVDTIGLAGSSRPDNYKLDFTPKESIEYFVEYLENWRKSMKNVLYKIILKFSKSQILASPSEFKDFILSGHSFGGYIAGYYAYKYP